MADGLLNRMTHICTAHRLLAPGDAVVVAVSGGPDSMALLHLLHRLAPAWRLRLTVAHVNHGFRGTESDAEERLVREAAQQWGWPCETMRVDMPALISREKGNAQDAARTARYRFLAETAGRVGATAVALAHHADDQAETVLMRLLRGAGTDGLEGMPIRRALDGVEAIRPLLPIYKAELLAYCRRHGIGYAEDSSNRQRKYLRNRLRLDVIPYLEQYNAQLIPALVRVADIAGQEHDYMQREAERLLGAIAVKTNGGYRLQRGELLACHVALQRRLIKLILSYLCAGDAADFRKVELVRGALESDEPTNIRLDLGGGVRLVREYDDVTLSGAPDDPVPAFAYRLDGCPMEVEISEAKALFTLRETDGPLPISANEAQFDFADVAFPITVRNRRPGDKIALPGVNGRKKVKDLFIDLKIPPSERERRLIVEDASGRILWIPGLRRSLHAPARPASGRILHMSVHNHIH